jgi:hypothetical protein
VTLEQSIKRALLLQCIFSILVLAGIYVHDLVSTSASMDSLSRTTSDLPGKLRAALYGSVLAIAGTILSARSIRRSARYSAGDGKEMSFSALVPIYSGLLNKLVIVGGGIAFGLIWLDLEPVYVVLGYFVVQVAAALPIHNDKR